MYKIKPLATVHAVIPSKSFFTFSANFEQPVHCTIYAWFIEGPQKNILVDTGGKKEILQRGFSFEMEEREPLEKQLNEKLNLKPEDIDIVIYTHLSVDHLGNTHLFKNAVHFAQEEELKFAHNPHPLLAVQYDYFKEASKGIRFEAIEGERDIVDGVRVIPSPGHSPGTQSVIIDTAKGKAVITGFCCLKESFNPPEPYNKFVSVFIHGVNLDNLKAYDSAMKIKEMADVILPLHEPEFETVEYLP